MRDLVALVEIGDPIGTFRPGQHFRVVDEEYADLLIAQKRARPLTPKSEFALEWQGATVCILASGPSLTEQHTERVRMWRETEGKVIAINTTFRLAPWADVIYACDDRWWGQYSDEVREQSKASLWTQSEGATKRPDLNVIASKRGDGLCKEKSTIHQGMNSGFQAINLAYHAGAKKIILLGFDMKSTHGRKHWHGDHDSPMNTRLPFKEWIAAFEKIDATDIEIINATPDSALKCFPMTTLEDALSDRDISHSRPTALQTTSV